VADVATVEREDLTGSPGPPHDAGSEAPRTR
jgi:hypothetical protein